MRPRDNKGEARDQGVQDGPAQISRRVSVGVLIAVMFWFAVVGGATVLMTRYSNRPSAGGNAPVAWPTSSKIPFDFTRPTLVMFVHPHCPCTRASLGELECLLAQVPGRLSVHLVFLKPLTTETEWEKTALWRKASSLPDVSVHTDYAGTEARRFHSQTSGQTLLYDPDGILRFAGGITLARGHAGDNPGRSALEQLVQSGHSEQFRTPVFGCPLFASQCLEGERLCQP